MLGQSFPHENGGEVRMGTGSFLLIAETCSYWGTNRLPPPIKCHPAKGFIVKVKLDLIRSPPKAPWMFIEFQKETISAADLRVNVSDDIVFLSGGETPMINRRQVMAMLNVGMTGSEWKNYVLGFTVNTERSLEKIRPLREKYPALRDIVVPPIGSIEYRTLLNLLKDKQ
jgi:hypothetical protein